MTEHNDVPESINWVGKLKLTFTEEEDGSALIQLSGIKMILTLITGLLWEKKDNRNF